MDEHMGRRTVGGLLFTKGGSILLFREDSSRRKATSCCSRLGCSSRHLAGDDKGRQAHGAAAAAKTPRRSQVFRKASQGSGAASDGGGAGRNAASPCAGSDVGRAAREAPGRDLLARLKERVGASRKRSLTRESSPPSSLSSSSTSGLGASSSSSGAGARSVSRPSRRAASRVRRETEEVAGADGARGHAGDDARRNPARSEDEFLLLEQAARDDDQAPTEEGFVPGFLARYRSSLAMEDSSGYWRFDMEGTEELESFFILHDRHRGMRMDIDGLSYEELLTLGERMGTVSTGLSDDALSKCLNASKYMPTASETHEDCDKKCSICQEEYLAGEEIGEMACKHCYHVRCIQQWLRQKNWCPICKSVALNASTD